MASLTDPSVAEAVRLLYKASVEQQQLAQDALDLADRQHTVISGLHDLLLEVEAPAGLAAAERVVNTETFLVTFPVGGPLRNCYTTITAATEYEARLELMNDYGRAGWAGIYPMRDKARVVDRHGLAFIPYGPINGVDYAAEGEAIS